MNKYTAIILTSHRANEFDRIYIMYTLEKGLVRAVAKGVRKPTARLAGHLEPLTLSEVYIARSRGMGQITSSTTISDYKNIKKNFVSLEEALVVLNFFAKNFRDEEEDEKIFELLRGYLEILNSSNNKEKADVLAEAFWWKLFDHLGQKPETTKCVKCGQRLSSGQDNFFSAKKGGILCNTCKRADSESFLINENQIKLLRLFFGNTLASAQKIKISQADIKNLEKIRKNYQRYYFG